MRQSVVAACGVCPKKKRPVAAVRYRCCVDRLSDKNYSNLMFTKSQISTFRQLSAGQYEALCELLRCSEAVVCAYLFGSAAKDRLGPLSDVDIGVLLNENDSSDDVLVVLEAELSRCLPGRTLDLISLTHAPCHLAYRIIRDGRLLVNKDPAAKEAFEVRAITGYLDFKPMRDLLLHGTRRAILRTA